MTGSGRKPERRRGRARSAGRRAGRDAGPDAGRLRPAGRGGFADEQVAAWFGAAGLQVARVETLEGGELTVKLWLGRKAGARLSEVKAA